MQSIGDSSNVSTIATSPQDGHYTIKFSVCVLGNLEHSLLIKDRDFGSDQVNSELTLRLGFSSPPNIILFLKKSSLG